MSNELGHFLEELRGKMSLREAAEKSGLSHTYIRDLELGVNRKTKAPIRPSADTLRQLAMAYNHPAIHLLKKAGYIDSDETLDRKNSNESIFFFDQENITPEELEALREHLEFLRYKAAKENKKKEN